MTTSPTEPPVDVRRVAIPIVLVAAILLAGAPLMLYAGGVDNDIEQLRETIADVVKISESQGERLRTVELRSSRNEERVLANQGAINDRLRRIEASLERLEEWVQRGRE